MRKATARVFSRAFKLAAINRMEAGENVSVLARELRLRRKLLYEWREALRSGGPEALRSPGRPRKAVAAGGAKRVGGAPGMPAAASELAQARQRIAELERKVGQQQLDLDFFKQALRQVGTSRQPSNRRGAPASTPSSKR